MKKYFLSFAMFAAFAVLGVTSTAQAKVASTDVSDEIIPFAEQVADAELVANENFRTQGRMLRQIIDARLDNGKTVRLGIFPTGYTKNSSPIYMYTTDGYNFYKTPKEAISPSWWQRLWASSKPTTDKEIARVAKDLYSGKYNYGSKDRSRADTWIERGSFEKLLREYIKRREEGKLPEQILYENSDFLDLVTIKSNNPYADLIKDKNLFEAGYQTVSGFLAFDKPLVKTEKPATETDNESVVPTPKPIVKPTPVPAQPTTKVSAPANCDSYAWQDARVDGYYQLMFSSASDIALLKKQRTADKEALKNWYTTCTQAQKNGGVVPSMPKLNAEL